MKAESGWGRHVRGTARTATRPAQLTTYVCTLQLQLCTVIKAADQLLQLLTNIAHSTRFYGFAALPHTLGH